MNNGAFVDTKISRALTRSLGQLHNISFLGGKAYFWAPNEWLIKEKHLEENH